MRVRGRYRGPGGATLFRYDLRVHAWAGRSLIRVLHTFENDASASEFTPISSLILRLPLSGANRDLSAQRARTEQDRQSGTVRWLGGGKTITFSVREFWQNYPKDLISGKHGIELALCPKLAAGEYASANGTVDEHRLFYYLRGGHYRFRQGESKTHEFWIAAGEPSTRTQPSMAAAPATWYAASGALGHLALSSASDLVKRYDSGFEHGFAALLQNRQDNRSFGMMNFGDWWGEREVNWGNSEYDTQHSLLLQFVRTGDWRYFRAGEQAEWHNRDVDTVHQNQNPQMIGGVWEHKVGHTGGYFPGNPIPRMAEPGDMTPSHTFIEGHFDYYFLTGDRRSLETALLTADRYCGPVSRNFDLISGRQGGWLLMLAVAAYNATGDPYYLNFAHIVFERVLEMQTEDGGWRRKLARGHCDCIPRHMGNVGFMVGILMSSLRLYYEATGDERAADSILKAARFVVKDMWMPEVKAFRYTSCPKTAPSSGYLDLDGLAFAYARTGDPALAGPLQILTERLTGKLSGFGKSFTQCTRQAPRFIDFAAQRAAFK